MKTVKPRSLLHHQLRRQTIYRNNSCRRATTRAACQTAHPRTSTKRGSSEHSRKAGKRKSVSDNARRCLCRPVCKSLSYLASTRLTHQPERRRGLMQSKRSWMRLQSSCKSFACSNSNCRPGMFCSRRSLSLVEDKQVRSTWCGRYVPDHGLQSNLHAPLCFHLGSGTCNVQHVQSSKFTQCLMQQQRSCCCCRTSKLFWISAVLILSKVLRASP